MLDQSEQNRECLQSLVATAHRTVFREPDESRLLTLVCETLLRAPEIVLAWVGLPDADHRLTIAAAAGNRRCLEALAPERSGTQSGAHSGPHSGAHFGQPLLAEGPSLLAYRSGETQIDNRLLERANDLPWHDCAQASGIAALVALPLRSSAGVLGTLNLCADVADFFGDDAVRLLEMLAGAGGLALEARRTAAALVESEGRYREIFEHGALGIVHYDKDGTVVDCNSVYLSVLGADREQVIGVNLLRDLRDERVVQAVRRSLTQGVGHLDIVYPSKSWNRFVPVRAVFNGVRDANGKVIAGIGLLEDFTERREIAARLQDNEQRLRLAVDAARIGIWELDLEQGTLHWDAWMRRLHGMDDGTVLADVRDWRDRILPEDRFRAIRALLRAMHSDHASSARLRILLPDGDCRYLQLHASRFSDDNEQRPRVTGVCYDVTEQHLASARIEQLALFDELTGLANRRLLMDRLGQAITQTQRQTSYRALLLIDLDGFKRVNDTRGHAVGDRLLVEFAERLRHALRRTDTAARLGGDEFVVLCAGLSASAEAATQEAARIASKLVDAAEQPYWLGGSEDVPVYCSASIGITLFHDESHSSDELMKQADIAMYEAKRNGRDTWQFFEVAMQRTIELQEQKTQALRQALQEDQLVLRYLPQVDDKGRWCGYEALVRWHAEHELRRPDEFLELAESSGLIQAIDDWVLTRACRDFAALTAREPPAHLHLGVNVSIRQLLDTDFAERVMQTVHDAGLQPRHLRLEVTEQALFLDVERARAAIEHLQRSGIAIVLDDFGTGSSSLLQLQRLSLQGVKIDQGLVRDIEKSPTKIAIVRAAISAAHALSLSVIAEGVENKAQFRLLRAEGCSVFQGYYFAEPMPLDALSRHLDGNEGP